MAPGEPPWWGFRGGDGCIQNLGTVMEITIAPIFQPSDTDFGDNIWRRRIKCVLRRESAHSQIEAFSAA